MHYCSMAKEMHNNNNIIFMHASSCLTSLVICHLDLVPISVFMSSNYPHGSILDSLRTSTDLK